VEKDRSPQRELQDVFVIRKEEEEKRTKNRYLNSIKE
jgi:hypothetical protein